MALSQQDLLAFHSTAIPTAGQASNNKANNKKGNFFTNLLPTVGGTAGGIGGGALGGALAGSAILPGVGTAIGGLAGALIGGATGGAAGKLAENKLEGNALGEGVTGAAIENGIFAAGPLRLAKGGKSLLTAGKTASADTLAGALTKNALKDTSSTIATKSGANVTTQAIEQPLKNSLQGKFTDLGNKALANQYGTISKPVARANDPLGTIGKLADYGVTKPIDAERIAGKITGSTGIVNQAVIKAVGGSSKVQLNQINSVVDNALQKSGLVDSDAKSIKAIVDAQLKKVDTTAADPKAVLGIMKDLEKQIAHYKGKGATYHLPTATDGNKAAALGTIRDNIENSLYKTAGANKNVASVLTPDFRKSLFNLQPNNPQWQKFVDDNVMKSTSVKQLRSTMAPFVRAGKIIEEGDTNALTFGGRVSNNLSNGQIPSIGGAVISAGTNLVKNPASRLAGNVLRKVGGAEAAKPTSLAAALTAPSNKQIARNVIAGNAVTGLLGGNEASATSVAEPTTGINAADEQAIAQLNQTIAPEAPVSDPSQDVFNPINAQANIQRLLAAGGTLDDVKTYLGLVETIGSLNSSGGSQLNATQAASVATSDNGLNTLDQLAGLYETAGGGQGKIGGGVSQLLAKGGFNGNVQSYQDLSQSAVSQLAKAINGGGQVSDADAAVIISALPKVTDSADVAATKFAALKQRLAAARQNTLMYAGATDPSSTAITQ